MTQEQIKAKAKEYFPNDEFKQQIVIDAINWATKELQKENAELKEKYVKNITDCDICDTYCNSQLTKAKELLKQLVDIEYAINIPKEKIISLRVKAEQFISEVEK